MKAELEKKLLDRFPLMYRAYHLPMSETCMCWGFDHSDGWFDIIWVLSLAIEEELGYSWLQTKRYLLLDKFSHRWNDLIYKLSPVRQRKYKIEGKGTKEDPMHQVLVHIVPPPIDEKIAQFLFGKTEKVGKFETDRIFLKKLSMQSVYTGFRVEQVKEKFGTLRFYVSAANDRIYRLITLAEELSSITCENCGKRGKLIGNSWVRTLCEKCNSPKETK